MKLEFSQHIFEKSSHIKFNENPSCGSRIILCWWTDGHTCMTNLTVAFRSFANAIKNLKYSLSKHWRRTGWAKLELHPFLTSAPNGGELSTAGPGSFSLGTNAVTHWIGSWVGPRAGLNTLEKNKTLLHTLIRAPHRSSCSLLVEVWLRMSVKGTTN